MANQGVLTFFCGKMGAGKTTMSKRIAAEQNAVLLSEDDWLAQLYPGQIQSFDDYLNHSRQIRPLARQLVMDILLTGSNVVMDFPANTVRQRSWFKNLCAEAGCAHEMIYLVATDETCLQHLATRRQEQPERSAFDTAEVFLQVTRYFEEPEVSEELNIRQLTLKS